LKLKIPLHIQSIRPYSTGKPIEELARETGAEKIVKLASNENPLGPSPLALEALRGALDGIHRYPDGSAYALVKKLSALLAVEPETVVVGNGSDDLIGMLTRALLSPGDEAIMGKPSFLMYDISTRVSGAEPVAVPLKDLTIDLDSFLDRVTEKTRMVFVCNPNNPTGTVVSRSRFESFLEALPDSVVVVIDEAYAEFVRDIDSPRGLDYLGCGKPVVVLRTFSKAYGLAGLRIGYGIMPAAVASLLHRVRQPFTANLLGQVAAVAALDDTAFLDRTVRLTHEGLDFLYHALDQSGIRYFPTQTNFFLIDVERDADEIYRRLLAHGIIVRSMTSYDYPTCIRVNVGLSEENTRFIEALRKVLS
jgi:histidinol-phosphate aminotransferase